MWTKDNEIFEIIVEVKSKGDKCIIDLRYSSWEDGTGETTENPEEDPKITDKEVEEAKKEVENEKNSTQEERFPNGWNNMSAEAIRGWFSEHEISEVDKLDGDVREKWIGVIKEYLKNNRLGQAEAAIYSNIMRSLGASEEEANEAYNTSIGDADTIFRLPEINAIENGSESLDDAIGDAETFLSRGSDNLVAGELQKFSRNMYNILLTIGIIIAVIMGGVLGIKFVTETGPEGKAEVMKLLIPYVAGCIIVFGGFAIWKIVVTILSGM